MPAGSLLVVLLLRTAHYNLAKLRDVYLHTNTLAALANLAPYAQDLSSHAAQRLVSLFDMLARRWLPIARSLLHAVMHHLGTKHTKLTAHVLSSTAVWASESADNRLEATMMRGIHSFNNALSCRGSVLSS